MPARSSRKSFSPPHFCKTFHVLCVLDLCLTFGGGLVASRVLLSVVIASTSLTSLAPYSIDFARAGASAAQLFKLIDRESAINPFDESGEQPSETVGRIELENVTFAYPTRPGVTVLDDFSLVAPAGKVTALVVSGSLLYCEERCTN